MRAVLLIAILLSASSPAGAVWWDWVGDLNTGGANCMLADPAHERLLIGGESGYRIYYPSTGEWLVREDGLPWSIFSLLAHPTDPLFLLSGCRGLYWDGWVEDHYGLVTEGPIVLGGTIGVVRGLGRLPGQDDVLFACAVDHGGDSVGLFRSSNGGQGWTLSHVFDPSDPTALAIASNSDLLVGLRSPIGIARGINAGESWIDATGDMSCGSSTYIEVIVVEPGDSQHIYALQSPGVPMDWADVFFCGVYETSDGGVHWEHLLQGLYEDLCMHPTDGDVLVALSSGGIVLTRDGGGTWVDIAYNLPAGRACAISPTDDRIYVATYGDGLWATDANPTAAEMAPSAGLALAAHPNPFNPKTTLSFSLREAGAVDLRILDAQGRLVRSLLTGAARPAGLQSVTWDGHDDADQALPSGVYFARLVAGAESASEKLLMLK